jgi:hypothetical protein
MKNNKSLSCNNCTVETKTVKLSELTPSAIRHEVLPVGSIVRVQRFKEILKEVETSSLEETVSNFQRDAHPERELLVWEKIAEQYELSVQEHPEWGFPEKKELFRMLLGASMGATA